METTILDQPQGASPGSVVFHESWTVKSAVNETVETRFLHDSLRRPPMSEILESPPVPLDPSAEAARQIERATHGRIRGLRVELACDRLLLKGAAPSYYVAQLAIAAALRTLPPWSALRVESRIEIAAAIAGRVREDRHEPRD